LIYRGAIDMPSKAKAKHKTHGGGKDFAAKNTMNPPTGGPAKPGGTHEPEEQDPERPLGQFGGAGEPPLMKK
jgi:hypothetical protein